MQACTGTIGRVMALVGLAGLLALGPVACGGGGDPTPAGSTRAYIGTQSPGDLWSWALHPDGTFDAENETLGYTYAGTYTSLPSDFLKLTVTSSTEPGMTLPGTAYAVEVPDSALVVRPVGLDSNVIVAVATSTCPAGPSFDLAWVELTRSTWDVATDDAYGTANVSVTGSTWDLVTSGFLLDGTATGTDVIAGLTCTAGIVTDPATPDAVIAIAPTGVFVRDGGPGEGGVMGMRTPSLPISLSDLVLAGREFRGFDYMDDRLATYDSVPVWARPDGEGGMHGGEYDDIETNVETADPPATIAFGAQTSPGIVNATLTDRAGTSDIVFMINKLGGRYFVFGISVDTHDGHPYNFVAIETGP